MYTLPKKDGGYWVIRLVSNNRIQFRSLSRQMAKDWYDENETAANKAVAQAQSAKHKQSKE